MKHTGATTVTTPPFALLFAKHQETSIFVGFRSKWCCKVLAIAKKISKSSSSYSPSSFLVSAVDREEPEFEFDIDKARQSLRKLDEELESLSSKKQNISPKIRVPASELDSSQVPEMNPEIVEQLLSTSFLGGLATALILFTIIYNFIFLTVIKPSIDGPDEPVVSSTFGTE